jgi:hypothetical protein
VEFDNQTLSSPRVAMTPQGEFVVVWANPSNVFLSRFDRLGRPLGSGAITQQPTPGFLGQPDVAIDPAGNAAVVWPVSKLNGDVLYLQRFNAAGQPLGAPEAINQGLTGSRRGARVTYGSTGSLLVSWDDYRTGDFGDIWARLYDGPSGTWSPELRVNENSPGAQSGSSPLIDPFGNASVVYSDFSAGKIMVRRVTGGAPAGSSIVLGDLGVGGYPPDAAIGEDGTALVAWTPEDLLVHARFFDVQWNPLSADFQVSSVDTDAQTEPTVAAGGAGFSVAWTSVGRGQFFPVLPPPQLLNGRDGDLSGIFAQRFQNPTCAGGSEVLCLNGGQFQARVTWKNPYTGETGTGKTVPLSDDTGSFWFFSPNNLELMVKVLNGEAINGSYWVFYGSLSNVEYTLTITDTASGTVKTYHNDPLQLASRSDIDAFPVNILSLTSLAAPVVPTAPALLEKAGVPDGDCVASPTVLCLQRKMYQVEVDFTDPRDGNAGHGRAIALTDDTGAFWFFGPENLELMVKVLDGHGINGHQWVFFGGLSDVEYTLTVTERATGKKKTYHNARHQQAAVMDLEAF